MPARSPFQRRPNFSNTILAVLLAAAAGGASIAPLTALAAEATTANVAKPYKIAPGALEETLIKFAAAADISITIPPALVQGKYSKGLEGSYPLETALAKLLADTGLEASGKEGVYLIKATPKMQLQKIKVQATALTANTEGTGSYTTGVMNTATKLDLSIRETPQSVTVVTSQVLEDLDIQNINRALRLTPGVSDESPGPGFSSALSRGFALENLLIDGQTFNLVTDNDRYFFSTLNTASFDHIEVVRGATGMSSGSGDPSGSVNIIRKRASENPHAKIQATVANYQTYNAELDISSPLTESKNIRGRLVAGYEDQQDHIQNFYSKSRPVIYGVIDADLSDKTSASVAIDWQQVNGDGLSGYDPMPAFYDDGTLFKPSRSFNLSPAWERADQTQQLITLSLTHKFSDDWSLSGAYAKRKAELFYQSIASYGLVESGNLNETYAQRANYDDDRDTLDLSVNGHFKLFGYDHQVVFGYTRSQQDAVSDSYWEGDVLAPVNIYTFNPGTYPEPEWFKGRTTGYDVTQSAVYGSSQWKLAERFAVLIGARISNYQQDETVLFDGYDFTEAYSSADYDHKNVFTPYAGFVYDLTDTVSVYASHTEIFKIQSDSVRDVNRKLLAPMDGTNSEVGIKSELLDDQITVSAAFFKIDQKNVATIAGQFTAPEDIRRFGRNYFVGTGGRTAEGAEFEVSGQLTSSWQVMGGFTTQRLKFAGGKQNEGIPESIINLTSRYQFSGALKNLSVGGAIRWRDKTQAGPYTWANNQYNKQDAYMLADIWGNYALTQDLFARLNIDNATDKIYHSNMNGYLNYGEARRIRFTLGYSF